MDHQFHVTLPSNVENKQFDNKLNHYYTKLPVPLELSDDWEVALSDISFTFSWPNLLHDNYIWVVDNENIPNKIEDKDKCKFGPPYCIPAGTYRDVEHIANLYETLASDRVRNNTRTEKEERISVYPSFKYDEKTSRIRATTGTITYENNINSIARLQMTPELRSLLGFSPLDTNYLSDGDAPDFAGSVGSIFIYSNIVKHSIVGDKSAQLLRVIHVPSKLAFGHRCTVELERLQYCSLQLLTISEIEIVLRDDTGQLIQFNKGKTTITLHFRKKKHVFE